MKTIELDIWWSCGGDSDGYETDFYVSNEEYNTIVELVQKYAVEICHIGGSYIDPRNFTKKYFKDNARSLYDKIEKETYDMIFSTTIATAADDWFDEVKEGCTIEEYIERVYFWGFHFTEEFLSRLIED